jgi:hypothetical protein
VLYTNGVDIVQMNYACPGEGVTVQVIARPRYTASVFALFGKEHIKFDGIRSLVIDSES